MILRSGHGGHGFFVHGAMMAVRRLRLARDCGFQQGQFVSGTTLHQFHQTQVL